MQKKQYIAQGDVLLFPIDALPEGARLRTGADARVLARGESTGAVHEIGVGADVYERDGVLYIKVNKNTPLTHTAPSEAHLEMPVTREMSQFYRVQNPLEYDHFAEESKSVKD